MQNNQSQRIYNARHNERTQSTAPAQQPSHNWGNGGWRTQQAGMTQQAPRQQQPQQSTGNGGWRMQQASMTPQAPRVQQASMTPQAPRVQQAPRMQQASAPAAPRPAATAPSGGQRTRSR